MELHNGSRLQGGKYTITRKLGQGSFGITYLAKARFNTSSSLGDMQVEADVAIKEFFMSEVNTRSADGNSVDGSKGTVFGNYRRKFRKEAENLAKLHHSNIVKVFEVFDENGTTYYAMEFLDGLNLDDYIRQRGRIPENEAIGILSDIGTALAYMHSRRMLHLDIKPKNVMRRTDGDNCLIDFGLSKQFTADGEPESSTTIGLGTPGYAPLEQAQQHTNDGTHQFPATLDVYALGATLYKMLTGKRPPEATFVLNDGFPDGPLRQAGVSDRTIKALRKAMAPIKKDRWASIDEFLSALGGKTAQEDTPVTPVAPAALTIKNTWNHRNWFVNLMGVMTLMVFLIILIIFQEHDFIFFSLVPATGVYGVLKLMYGEKQGWSLVLLLLLLYPILDYVIEHPDLDFYLGNYNGLVVLSPIIFIFYLATLFFIKKNGHSVFSLLRPIKFGFSNFRRWPLASKIIAITTISLVCILGYLSSWLGFYYPPASLFTFPIFAFSLLRGRRTSIIIMFLLITNYSYSNSYNIFAAILLVILLLSLIFIRKNGRSAWQVMR